MTNTFAVVSVIYYKNEVNEKEALPIFIPIFKSFVLNWISRIYII